MGLLEQSLSTFCQSIDTEAADGIGLPAPTAWFNARGGKMFGDTAQVNVWCESFTSPDWQANATNWSLSTDAPFSAEYVIKSRLTHSNRAMLSFADMETRSQRYAAALIRCITRAHPTLLAGGVAFVNSYDVAMDSTIQGDPETERRFDSIEMSLVLCLTEDSSGEGAPSGGSVSTVLKEQIRT
jgi:hypothetical protein